MFMLKRQNKLFKYFIGDCRCFVHSQTFSTLSGDNICSCAVRSSLVVVAICLWEVWKCRLILFIWNQSIVYVCRSHICYLTSWAAILMYRSICKSWYDISMELKSNAGYSFLLIEIYKESNIKSMKNQYTKTRTVFLSDYFLYALQAKVYSKIRFII